MRLAIYDNLANNAYIQAKAYHRRGRQLDVVQSPLDRFAMSDPRWEDSDLELPTDGLLASALPDEPVAGFVRQLPAAPPGPRTAPLRAALRPASLGRAVRAGGPLAAWFAGSHGRAIETLREYDCVLGYGVGPVVAHLAGVPCVGIAYGGDLCVLPFSDEGAGVSRFDATAARLQRAGYVAARRILVGDPGFRPFAERLGHGHKTVFIPTIVDTEKYSPGDDAELRESLLGGRAGPLAFVPARQDWHWKGSDNMLRGFAEVTADHPEALLVCAGWGADLERSLALADDLALGERVRFLPHAMSKTRLLRHYRASDVVLDQFGVLGSYGTSALEAMSAGVPLLIHLERKRFESVFDEFPPVGNCKEPGEIADWLRRLFEDSGERARLGADGRRWVVEHHGDALVDRQVEVIEAAMA
ncbi:MAG: hypothetical protein QOJ82_1027 [Solirubrobacteraceae bacterium]|nr:hypothetical protein [Solirubrobacteraceae bacterium]